MGKEINGQGRELTGENLLEEKLLKPRKRGT